MANIQTSQGKPLDMASLIKKNETVRAVSNLTMNARGDIINPNGKVIESANARINRGNKTALEQMAAEREIEAAARAANSKGKK